MQTLINEIANDPITPVPRKDDDLISLYCQERFNFGACWQWHSLDGAARGVPTGFVKIKGGEHYPVVGGKRDGKRDWKKPVHGTQATVIVEWSQFEQWKLDWEQRTGKCSNCAGDGKELERWDHIEGTTLRACGRCKGTGLKP